MLQTKNTPSRSREVWKYSGGPQLGIREAAVFPRPPDTGRWLSVAPQWTTPAAGNAALLCPPCVPGGCTGTGIGGHAPAWGGNVLPRGSMLQHRVPTASRQLLEPLQPLPPPKDHRQPSSRRGGTAMYFAGKTPQSCPVPRTPDTRDALERITPAAQPCSRGVSSRWPLSPIFTFAIPFPATPAISPGSPTCSVQVPPAQPKFGQSFPSRVEDPGPPTCRAEAHPYCTAQHLCKR